MPTDVQLRIATQVLPGLLAQNPTRTIDVQMVDLRYSLELASALVQLHAEKNLGGALALLPPSGSAPRVQAASVDRDRQPPSMPASPDAWRASRGLPPAKPEKPNSSRSGPQIR